MKIIKTIFLWGVLCLGGPSWAEQMMFGDAVQQQVKNQRQLEVAGTPQVQHARRNVTYWDQQKKGLESLVNKTYDTNSAHAKDEKDDAYYENQANFALTAAVAVDQNDAVDSDGETDDDADEESDSEASDSDDDGGESDSAQSGDDDDDSGDDDDDSEKSDDDGEGDTGNDDDDA